MRGVGESPVFSLRRLHRAITRRYHPLSTLILQSSNRPARFEGGEALDMRTLVPTIG